MSPSTISRCSLTSRKKTSLLVLLLLLTVSGAYASRDDVCESDPLPDAAEQVLKEKFPSMYLEKPSDLSQEYRKQWFEKHELECPGLVSGHFVSGTKKSYAVLLVGSKGALSGAKVVVLSETAGKWKALPVHDERTSYYYQAISKLPHKGALDGIGLITFEQGSRVYRYANGRFR
jgi:hypothetical protein